MNAVWRDASRDPAFFGVIDVRAAFPVLLFVVHMSWTTFFIAIGGLVFFGVLGMAGYSLPVLYRKVRGFLRGGRVYSTPWWLLKKWRSR